MDEGVVAEELAGAAVGDRLHATGEPREVVLPVSMEAGELSCRIGIAKDLRQLLFEAVDVVTDEVEVAAQDLRHLARRQAVAVLGEARHAAIEDGAILAQHAGDDAAVETAGDVDAEPEGREGGGEIGVVVDHVLGGAGSDLRTSHGRLPGRSSRISPARSCLTP